MAYTRNPEEVEKMVKENELMYQFCAYLIQELGGSVDIQPEDLQKLDGKKVLIERQQLPNGKTRYFV